MIYVNVQPFNETILPIIDRRYRLCIGENNADNNNLFNKIIGRLGV